MLEADVMQTLKQAFTDAAILAKNWMDVTLPLSRMEREPCSTHSTPTRRILILASDPQAPDGSMGEMAMLSGLMQAIRQEIPAASFTIVGTHDSQIVVPQIGTVPVIAAWVGRAGTGAFHRALTEHDAVFCLGADVLDGKYGAALVCRIASYLNHAARMGKKATVVGFSFNATPRRPARFALARLAREVRVNVRDQPSLQRFEKTTGRTAQLCADVAFLMTPAVSAPAEIESWIATSRSEGYAPVAINLNAHAFAPILRTAKPDDIVTQVAAQLAQAARVKRLSYLLVPHDTKPQAGDIRMLKALQDALISLGVSRVLYVQIPDTSEIKATVGTVDLVVTGRMHLAIAALGMSTPTLSITYQDKFEGLYQHLGLTPDDLVTPNDCLEDTLSAKILSAVERHDKTVAHISAHLDTVRALSLRNIEVLTQINA
jgi:polysaccharide pyruvyl transferase WcaK-like protein